MPRPVACRLAGGRGPQHIHIPDELVDKRAGGPVVDLLRRADLLDASLVHDDDFVGDLQGLLLVVGHKQSGQMDFVVESAEPAPEVLPDLGIERSKGLVEQEHLGFDSQSARKSHPLALTPGKLRG